MHDYYKRYPYIMSRSGGEGALEERINCMTETLQGVGGLENELA